MDAAPVPFLNDADALAWLELIRAQAAAHHALRLPPPEPYVLDEKLLRAVWDSGDIGPEPGMETFEQFRTAAQRRVAPPPWRPASPYDDAGLIVTVDDMLSAVIAAADRQALPPIPRPQIGTLPGGRVGGRVVIVDGTDRVVLFVESGLFSLANLSTKAIGAALRVDRNADGEPLVLVDPGQLPAAIEREGRAGDRFLELLQGWAQYGHPAAAPQYAPEPGVMHVASVLRPAMEQFVIARTYVLAIFGRRDVTAPFLYDIPGAGLHELAVPAELHHVADEIGLQLTVGAQLAAGNKLSVIYAGVDLLLSMLDIAAHCREVLGRPTDIAPADRDLPSPASRHGYLRHSLPVILGDEGAAEALDFTRMIDAVLNALWQYAEPRLTA